MLVGQFVLDELHRVGRRVGTRGTDLDPQLRRSQVDPVPVSERLFANPEGIDANAVLAVEIRDQPSLVFSTDAGMGSRNAFMVDYPIALGGSADDAGILPDDEDPVFMRFASLVMEAADLFIKIGQIESLLARALGLEKSTLPMFRPDGRDLKSETCPGTVLGCETPPQAGWIHPVGKASQIPLLHLIFQERPWVRGARGGGHTIVSIRTFQPSEAAHLSRILAEAFLDNPLNCAVINRKSRSRLQVNRAGMALTLDSAREGARVLTAWTDENQLAGGLIAVPPGRWPLPPPSFSQQLLGLWRQGIRISSRWGHIYQELALQHPEDPHWYLSTLGVHPKYQGRGLASALLDHRHG